MKMEPNSLSTLRQNTISSILSTKGKEKTVTSNTKEKKKLNFDAETVTPKTKEKKKLNFDVMITTSANKVFAFNPM